ncbi:nucleotidyltransferase domain-containing protein [Bradyrhizobium yuanmingense]|uniref:nucleotidyltransferase domain-containing protein n=1 Tax=Bradyrhizobium yuanmingense TaxID=108015 RepID=UPI0023B95909|nr:nucleotidyltransferase domain-containing protein [Bradyrhizobium yuanmingense]MDF0498249.1 nucleotidyltransferase domain-containing protein [Bradyrhizobium yuanmingense]
MALSVQSIRAKPEHREILQKVAALLRQEEGGMELRRFLENPRARPVGPFRDEEAAIAFLRDRLVADLRPLSIWFFGSRARGEARPASDFDLLVVLPDGLPEESYSHFAVAAPVVACGLACDIVPCSWSNFAKDRDDPTSLVHAAVTQGREIYRAREQRRGRSKT